MLVEEIILLSQLFAEKIFEKIIHIISNSWEIMRWHYQEADVNTIFTFNHIHYHPGGKLVTMWKTAIRIPNSFSVLFFAMVQLLLQPGRPAKMIQSLSTQMQQLTLKVMMPAAFKSNVVFSVVVFSLNETVLKEFLNIVRSFVIWNQFGEGCPICCT